MISWLGAAFRTASMCPIPLLPDRKISDKLERKGEINYGNYKKSMAPPRYDEAFK